MKEIQDDEGNLIPIANVKCVHGGLIGTARVSGPYDTDDGPHHFVFETRDGKSHQSKDYPTMGEAAQAWNQLRLEVDAPVRHRPSAP